MPYEATLEDDIKRAKEILSRGKLSDEEIPGHLPYDVRQRFIQQSGSICGADIYPAYKLLESFVAELETMIPQVAELQKNAQKWVDKFNQSEQFQNGPTKRAEAAEAKLTKVLEAVTSIQEHLKMNMRVEWRTSQVKRLFDKVQLIAEGDG